MISLSSMGVICFFAACSSRDVQFGWILRSFQQTNLQKVPEVLFSDSESALKLFFVSKLHGSTVVRTVVLLSAKLSEKEESSEIIVIPTSSACKKKANT